jgi:DNA polymerase-3 subunit delta'
MSVHEAQNIINKLSLKSYEGGYKFMIIWMPEFMRNDCANKLLKIVEEPPDNTLFFFVCSSTENILPTMLSRVQQVRIPVLDDTSIQKGLQARGVEEAKAADIAHFAGGDWYRALQLSENNDPNSLYAAEFQSWMRWCYAREVVSLAKWSEKMHSMEREDQKHFIRYALDQVRQNLLLNYVGVELARLNENEMQFSSKFARFINHDNAEELIEELSRAYEDISRNVYSRMVFFDLSLKTHRLLTKTGQMKEQR